MAVTGVLVVLESREMLSPSHLMLTRACSLFSTLDRALPFRVCLCHPTSEFNSRIIFVFDHLAEALVGNDHSALHISVHEERFIHSSELRFG